MSSGDQTLPAARRSRKSIGSMTRKATDKENNTVDVIGSLGANCKKSRSKSIGPGGLDALKQGTGNRRASLAVPAKPPPRSILKPSPSIPEIPPHSRLKKSTSTAAFGFGGDPLSNVPEVSQGSKVALRTEEQQQKAAREREERERRDARRKSLANRRVSFAAEATLHTFHDIEYMQDSTTSTDNIRRASAAKNTGRQEEESKLQSRSQSRSRRSSTGLQQMHSQHNNDDDTLASTAYGSSDSELIEEVEEDSSEEDSDADDGTMMSVEVEEMTSASVGSLLGSPQQQDESDTLEEALREAAQKAGTQRLDDEEEEEIIPSFGWVKKPAPKALPAPSRLPAQDQTQTMDMDMDMTTPMGGILQPQTTILQHSSHDQTEAMDMTMDVTQAVGGILARQMLEPLASDDHDYSQNEATMEFTTALGAIKRRESKAQSEYDDNEDMSMELTTVMGSVLSQQAAAAAAQRQQILSRIQNDDNATSAMDMDMDMDMDMEMTAAVGGILRNGVSSPVVEDDEDGGHSMTMGMDITTAVGRILGTTSAPPQAFAPSEDETFGMEMMTALGTILGNQSRAPAPAVVEHLGDEPLIDFSIGPESLPQVHRLREPGEDMGVHSSPFRATSPARSFSSSPFKSPAKSPPTLLTQTPSAPSLASAPVSVISGPEPRMTRSRSRSQSPEKPPSKTIPKPKPAPRACLSSKSPRKSPRKNGALVSTTPQVPPPMPQILEITAPSPGLSDFQQPNPTTEQPAPTYPLATPIDLDTPPALQGGRRTSRSPSGSPSLLRANRQSTAATTRPNPHRSTDENPFKKSTSLLFQQNPETGAFKPSVVLTPRARRLSGVGADRPGLGSPKVSAILDKRTSLGESTKFFPPPAGAGPKRGVVFESPKVLEREVIEEEVRENARRMAQREAEGGEATVNLREMIQALSPKKRTMSRKSLHVGSARGLLGKRPAELDSEDEDESRDGVKRLKGLPSSPVKAIRLQKPPSKEETSAGRTLFDSPAKSPTTPKGPTPKKNVSKFAAFLGTNGEVTRTGQFDMDELPELQPNDEGGDRIHLHEFLNMTTIRFVEMDATKKRHTMAPGRFDGSTMNLEADMTLERCVVAGACTVPMLELYQHSCRELKKYISEGRRIVREIETETFEENPPLFREYMSATPKMKKQMDDQFKNVKTHARLLSKAMWYEWRMKLQDGIKEGLLHIGQDMDEDQATIEKLEKLVSSVLPDATKRKEALTQERDNLELFSREIAACDPKELQNARDNLVNLTTQISDKRWEIEQLKRELEEAEAGIVASTEHKKECQKAIIEAEKVREECRGWTTKEVSTLKSKTVALEKKYGWSVTAISGSTLTMTYLQDIALTFDAAAFQRGQRNGPIDVVYVGDQRIRKPQGLTPERDFFVQCICEHVKCLPQSRTRIVDMLRRVGAAWDKCRVVSDDVRIARTSFPTVVCRDENAGGVLVKWSMLIAQLETRVEVGVSLEGRVSPEGVEVVMVPRAEIVYGESFNTGKMLEFWKAKAGEMVGEMVGEKGKEGGGKVRWCDVLVDLQARLLARGRKGRD